MRQQRPKSEDPIELVDNGFAGIPLDGFHWVPGQWGPHGSVDRFLIPISERSRAATVPEDAYVRLAKAELSERELLDFANDYGELGVSREHFHSDNTPECYAEPFNGWLSAVGEFQNSFRTWEASCDSNPRALRRSLESLGLRAGKDVRASARRFLIETINQHLRAGMLRHAQFVKPCYMDGCQWHTPPAKVTPHVSYELQFDARRDVIRAKVLPDNLLTAVWLQFADLVCGSRKVIRCELCGGWMDISETARPTAKRMHERCSRAARQRRWRENTA